MQGKQQKAGKTLAYGGNGYAVRNGAMTDQKNQGSWWFLRTPGSKNDRVMRVKADGSIDEAGIHVSSAGGTVRPALWIRNSPGRYASQQPNRITYNQYYTDETTGERKYSISIMETYDNSGRLTYSQDHVHQEFVQRTYDDYRRPCSG